MKQSFVDSSCTLPLTQTFLRLSRGVPFHLGIRMPALLTMMQDKSQRILLLRLLFNLTKNSRHTKCWGCTKILPFS